MRLLGAAHGWEVTKTPPPKSLSLISNNDETGYSYVFPKEDPNLNINLRI